MPADPPPTEDGRARRAREQRERRREEILAAARNVIQARGYGETSVDDVIAAAGIARGTFYNYFDGREAVFLELLDQFLAQLRGAVEAIPIDHPAPAAAMAGNVERMVRLLLEQPDLATLLFREAVGVNAEIDARVHAFYRFVRGHVLGALRKGEQRKLTRPVDRELVATAIIGAVKEVLYQHVVVEPDPELSVSRVAQAVFDFGFIGLRAGEST
jgi:AcrR family transcriptional regulator